MARGGLKPQELVRFKVKDYDEERDVLRVENSRRVRWLPVVGGAKETIRVWLDYHPDGDADSRLLVSRTETHYELRSSITTDGIRHILQRRSDWAEVPAVTPTQLREYCERQLRRSQLSVDRVNTLLGQAPRGDDDYGEGEIEPAVWDILSQMDVPFTRPE